MTTDVKKMAQNAKRATTHMATASSQQKDRCLKLLAENLKKNQDAILHANAQDISLAESKGLQGSLLERLSLKNKLDSIIQDVEKVVTLSDPVGEIFDEKTLPNGLHIEKRRTPIGVLGVIYESRPNVTIDISALAIKSGNCAVLRGGSETFHTNQVFASIIQDSLREAELAPEAIQVIASTDRSQVTELLLLDEYIDLIIPRGSAALQDFCRKNSIIPVILGGEGICHLFVDETANITRSLNVILNAKTQRPSVCNALDTLLVHEAIAPLFIPKVVEFLAQKHVTFRLDDRAWNLIPNHSSCKRAGIEDWDTEWLSLVLGIKVVKTLEEAIDHIQKHSRGHSDGILTEDQKHAEHFVKAVDSAAVYVNASTRFTDGGQFGLGAEVAVSTQKLHARGPMGLTELTSYKWVVSGDYQVRT